MRSLEEFESALQLLIYKEIKNVREFYIPIQNDLDFEHIIKHNAIGGFLNFALITLIYVLLNQQWSNAQKYIDIYRTVNLPYLIKQLCLECFEKE
jgi:hypothetical protein